MRANLVKLLNVLPSFSGMIFLVLVGVAVYSGLSGNNAAMIGVLFVAAIVLFSDDKDL